MQTVTPHIHVEPISAAVASLDAARVKALVHAVSPYLTLAERSAVQSGEWDNVRLFIAKEESDDPYDQLGRSVAQLVESFHNGATMEMTSSTSEKDRGPLEFDFHAGVIKRNGEVVDRMEGQRGRPREWILLEELAIKRRVAVFEGLRIFPPWRKRGQTRDLLAQAQQICAKLNRRLARLSSVTSVAVVRAGQTTWELRDPKHQLAAPVLGRYGAKPMAAEVAHQEDNIDSALRMLAEATALYPIGRQARLLLAKWSLDDGRPIPSNLGLSLDELDEQRRLLEECCQLANDLLQREDPMNPDAWIFVHDASERIEVLTQQLNALPPTPRDSEAQRGGHQEQRELESMIGAMRALKQRDEDQLATSIFNKACTLEIVSRATKAVLNWALKRELSPRDELTDRIQSHLYELFFGPDLFFWHDASHAIRSLKSHLRGRLERDCGPTDTH